jgi:hypothetical protein
MKQRIFLSAVLALVVSIGATIGLNAVIRWAKFPHAPLKITTTSSSATHAVAGSPTISVDQIDRILGQHNSPFTGHGQRIHELGEQYGIDPVYAMAFWLHESNFGTAGWAKVTLNPGNIRGSGQGGWTYFRSWDDGIEAWYRLISHYTSGSINFTNPEGYTCSPSQPCVSIEQIIPVYAPSTDGNNVSLYIDSVANTVDNWHGLEPASGHHTPKPNRRVPQPDRALPPRRTPKKSSATAKKEAA